VKEQQFLFAGKCCVGRCERAATIAIYRAGEWRWCCERHTLIREGDGAVVQRLGNDIAWTLAEQLRRAAAA